jgi:hypothetical protein
MTEKPQNQKFTFTEIFTTETSCDRSDRLYANFQGLLSPEEQEAFEKHLSTCTTCTKLLAELEESKLAAENTVLDAEQADRIFRINRSKIEDRLNRRFGIQQRTIPWMERLRFPAYLNAMMLVALAILIYPAYRGFVLDQQVARLQGELTVEKARQPKPGVAPVPNPPEPAVSPSFVYSVRNERGANENTIRIAFTETQKTFTLVFSVQAEEYTGILLEISQSTKTVWQSKSPLKSNLVSLNIHANDFSPGAYTLNIYGVSGSDKSQITTYKLLIE